MDDKQKKALDELLLSKKYRDICPETVKDAFFMQAKRHTKVKDIDKAARAHLHAISGAFISPDELSDARKAVSEWINGDENALTRALLRHSSTRERIEHADALFARVFEKTGKLESILDLACGINPIYLGSRGFINVTGIDIHAGCAELINECAEKKGWKTRARAGDILKEMPKEKCDIALMMKLLPVLETQKAGAAAGLLNAVQSKFMCVTFPTETLGGRKKGMEKHYTEWFEKVKPENIEIIDRFVCGSELVYTLERK